MGSLREAMEAEAARSASAAVSKKRGRPPGVKNKAKRVKLDEDVHAVPDFEAKTEDLDEFEEVEEDALQALVSAYAAEPPSASTFTTAASAYSIPAFNDSTLDDSAFNDSASVAAAAAASASASPAMHPPADAWEPHFPSTIIEIGHYPADPHTAFGIALRHYVYAHAILAPVLAVFPHGIPPYQPTHLAPTAS